MDEENTLLWKQRIQNCLESNLPVRTWCNQNHISPAMASSSVGLLILDVCTLTPNSPLL